MIITDFHHIEKERLSALRRYETLNLQGTECFNKITSLASVFFDVPISVISLVDHDRIWFKSGYGLDLNHVSKDTGLCATAIMYDDIYVIEDAQKDLRCLSNQLVTGDFGLKFYAAAPLTTKDGHNLGTFCIMDKKPRILNENQKIMLQQMAEIVMGEMDLKLEAQYSLQEKNKKITELEEENKRLKGQLIRTTTLD